jgi:hypothetical protein
MDCSNNVSVRIRVDSDSELHPVPKTPS